MSIEKDKKIKPILIVGLPRSGTTWQFNVMRKAHGIHALLEPDNEKLNPFAIIGKESLHRFPQNPNKDNLEHHYHFWLQIFSGGWKDGVSKNFINRCLLIAGQVEFIIQNKCDFTIPENNLISYKASKINYVSFFNLKVIKKYEKYLNNFTTDRVLVKSVHCLRQLDWIKENFNPNIVLLTRGLKNLIASYLRLKLPDALRGISTMIDIQEKVEEIISYEKDKNYIIFHMIVIQACELTYHLIKFHKNNADTKLFKHEEVCINPTNHFQKLFESLDLTWNSDLENYLNDVNKKGSKRKAVRLVRNEKVRYKDDLNIKQIEIIERYGLLYKLENYL